MMMAEARVRGKATKSGHLERLDQVHKWCRARQPTMRLPGYARQRANACTRHTILQIKSESEQRLSFYGIVILLLGSRTISDRIGAWSITK